MRRVVIAVVVILLLVTLAGILIGFVAKVRAAAAQIQCRNNLKSIAFALHNYRETMGWFPAAAVENDSLPLEKRLSWHFDLDPYVHARMDPAWKPGRTKSWDAEVNGYLVEGPMPWLLCPANPNQGQQDAPGLTHYVGVAGVGRDAAELPKGDPKAGVFGYRRRTRLKDITDGPSATLLVIETTVENGPWAAAGFSTARGLDPDDPPYLGAGGQFASGHPRQATNAAFADLSIRPLARSVSTEVLEGLATIAGGEDVGPDI